MSSTLCLHCGSNARTRAEVDAIGIPEATDTYQPIPHSALIDLVGGRIKESGFDITSEEHGLWHPKSGLPGDRYFGLFNVAPAGGDGASLPDDYSLVFGLRNSHDKSFPAGICLGSRVFVCDNLAFSGEVVIGRRHTKNIMTDLPVLVNRAMGRLAHAQVVQGERLEAYQETDLTDTNAKALIIDAMRAKAINTTRVPKVAEQWFEPEHEEFAEKKNVWRLMNAFTEVYKGINLTTLPPLTQNMHGILDKFCGLVFKTAEEEIQGDVIDVEVKTYGV